MRRRAAVVARENTIVFSYNFFYSPSACYVAAWPRLGLAVPTCRPKELAAARNFGEEQACWRLAAQHGVSAAQDSVPIHRKRGDKHGLGELRGEASRSECMLYTCTAVRTQIFLKLN